MPVRDLAPEKIHQASELNSHYRAILNEARGGHALVRDTDGTGLIITGQHHFDVLRLIAEASGSFATIADAHMRSAPVTDVRDLGDWTWVRYLDADDQAEFLREIAAGLLVAVREFNPNQMVEALHAWEATANSLSDGLRRDILLNSVSASDFDEVPRPEEADDLAASSV